MDKGIIKLINSYILCLQKENLQFKKVYLFGSYAKNKQSAPMSSEDFTPENPLACEILNTGVEII